jgi:hypothetical protein
MVVYVYDVSAAELARVEGGFDYFLKLDGIELTSFQWGIGRGLTT